MKKKILIVDDNRLLRKFLSTHLERAGHQVRTAEDGFAALDVLSEFAPDVMFVDLFMPKIDGDRLCQIVRSRDDLKDCYLVILSAGIAETGKDYRGKDWSSLQNKLKQCRTIIIPCGNPDGRRRCPYDSFLGLPTKIMTKYGQGTHKDGTSWGWPQAKSVHPMKGDVGILGAYFNDDGINMMHDDFFAPMAEVAARLA